MEYQPSIPSLWNSTKEELIAAAKQLDPYGSLNFVVGSSDDFVCLDYAIVGEHGPRGIFGMAIVIKAVLNSETGSFIQDFGYWDSGFDDSPYVAARNAVNAALDWCAENNVKHNKTGWNQDPHYLTRVIFKKYDDLIMCDGPAVPRLTQRQLRFGGKRINSCIGLTK
jgi:hypothetical protein